MYVRQKTSLSKLSVLMKQLAILPNIYMYVGINNKDGRITCDFTSLSTVFKLYRDDEFVI